MSETETGEITGWEAVELIYTRKTKIMADDGNLLSQAIDDFVQAAYSGAIDVWGRGEESGEVVKIDRNFWATATVDM